MDVVTAVSREALRPMYLCLLKPWQMLAVAGGMPRQQAYKFAAQAVLGSAKMVLETGKTSGRT